MTPDIETLNKEVVFPRSSDTPDIVYVAVENLNHSSSDIFKLEPYFRLKALPQDLMKLITCVIEAHNISEKITALVPDLGRAQPTHYPSGIVELQWRLDDGSTFGLVLSNFSSKLNESEGRLSVERRGKIIWRFHGPRDFPRHGEFANVEELLEFVAKSFVSRE